MKTNIYNTEILRHSILHILNKYTWITTFCLNILKHRITYLLVHPILILKQLLKNKSLMLNLYIRDNNQNNQNKKPLLTCFKILILLKINHYTHHYHKSQIYNSQIRLKQLQFMIHQNSLKKQYKIHEALQKLMTQIL